MILSSSQLCSYISLPVCESRCDKKRAHTSLIKKGPKNFDDLLQQTRKYINLEEAVKMKKGKLLERWRNWERRTKKIEKRTHKPDRLNSRNEK